MNYIADDMMALSESVNEKILKIIEEEIEENDKTNLKSMFFILRIENPDKTCEEDSIISITNSKSQTKEEFNALTKDIAQYVKTVLESE
jgi:hypothetical protein